MQDSPGRGAAPAPGAGALRLPRYQAAAPFESRKAYRVGEFTTLHDAEFVDAAYRGVLGRAPDTKGGAHHLALLRTGELGKVDLLRWLRHSPEGRDRGVAVGGLRLAVLSQGLQRAPLLGGLVSWCRAFVRLPSLVREFQQFAARSQRAQTELGGTLNVQAATLETAFGEQQTVLERNSRVAAIAVAQLSEHVGQTQRTLSTLTPVPGELSILRDRFDRADLPGLAGDMRTTRGDLSMLRATLADHAANFSGRTNDLDRALSQVVSRMVDRSRVEATETAIEVLHSAKADATKLTELAAMFEQRLAHRADVAKLVEQIAQTDQRLAQKADRDQLLSDREMQSRELQVQRSELQYARSRVDRLADHVHDLQVRVRDRAVSPGEDAAADHALDAFYVAFENNFRGSRELILKRAEAHLPVIREALHRAGKGRVLDIGCGRGEWLQLLAQQRIDAYGIDLNEVMAAECRAAGLDVSEGDALAYLQSLPEASLIAVTGMHIVEHIPFATLIALFDEALRVLKPGGAVLFETPNPENLIVGACYFYMDPTHRHPLPPLLLEYVAQARGFGDVEIHRLSEHRLDMTMPEIRPGEPGSEVLTWLLQRSREHLFAAPDYAVVGYKLGGHPSAKG